MKIYLDCCCFNRPFDDLRQDRIRIEADAVEAIFARIESGEWDLISGDVVLFELSRMPHQSRRTACWAMASKAVLHVGADDLVREEARRLAALGLDALDAAHVASAKSAQASVILTVDDLLLRRAGRIAEDIGIPVRNPVAWLLELEEGAP